MARWWRGLTLAALAVPSLAVGSAAVLVAGTPAAARAAPPAVEPLGFQAVTPYRLLDTREIAAPLGPGETRLVPVVGEGPIPSSGVTAVAVNVTATDPTEPSFLTVWPSGTAMPATSTVNFMPLSTVPNAALVAVGSDGMLSVFNLQGSVDVIVDVTGWFSAGGGFTGVNPERLLDTRLSSDRTPLGPDGTIDLAVTGVAGVPTTGVTAVALNVTDTEPTAASFLTVWPAGSSLPLASNVNVLPGQTVANSVVVGVGAGGKVSIFNKFGSAHIVVDVTGYLTGDGYVPITPARLADTRAPAMFANSLRGPLAGGQPVTLSGSFSHLADFAGELAFGPAAVVLNVTVTRPNRAAYLTLWPSGSAQPLASNLNFLPGQTVANTVVVGVDRNGSFAVALSGGGLADVVVDLVGYFPADGVGLVDLNWSARAASLGTDRVAVVFCETTPSNHAEALSTLRDVVTPYYSWLSGGRYTLQFSEIGTVTTSDPDACYHDLFTVAGGGQYTAALGISDSGASDGGAWGFAGTGIGPGVLTTFPGDQRAGVVSRSSVNRIGPLSPYEMIAAHEFGHTLDFPHSFVDSSQDLGYRQQYTNPMDVMSRPSSAAQLIHDWTPQGTVAINRFRAGWLDPSQVAVHRSSGATYTIDPIGGGGTQMVVIPSGFRGRFTTLDTRVRRAYDSTIDTEGVEVDVVDSTCPDTSCSGIKTRVAPAWGGPDGSAHVLASGSMTLGGVTITVTGRTGDSFTVRIDGVGYEFAPLSTSGLTTGSAITGYVCHLPGTNSPGTGVTVLAPANV